MPDVLAKTTRSGRRLRCAVYTRKSTEEGLDQPFNSLDAQREACAAFITSQRHEGWTLCPTAFDDGGFSGGTIERPALKRLIADIEAGLIDVVVVYKVDRLTRALSDFAKLVDVFDKRHVSFVSITQQFNTTTSMGRLTLNVLLSFAQFEREVIGERVRDKIAASKMKGMWMGGQPPLGYDVRDRKLVVNDEEAGRVVDIFQRYIQLKSVHALRGALAEAGIVSKSRIRSDGTAYGAQLLGRGALYAILRNRIYRGDITHKGHAYPGDHAPIIDQPLWDEVQALLAAHRADRVAGLRGKQPELLRGLLFDGAGERLTPTYSVKKGKRYRYYVSASLVRGRPKSSSEWRIPVANLDKIVIDRLCVFLREPTELLDLRGGTALAELAPAALVEAGLKLTHRLTSGLQVEVRATLEALIQRVLISPDNVQIALCRSGLADALSGGPGGLREPDLQSDRETDILMLSVSAQLRRVGREMRLVVNGSEPDAEPNPSLLRIIVRAHELHNRLDLDADLTIHDIARKQQLTPAYLYTLLRLRWLAPDITRAILYGQQPTCLNATTLMRHASRLPARWSNQRSLLGFS